MVNICLISGSITVSDLCKSRNHQLISSGFSRSQDGQFTVCLKGKDRSLGLFFSSNIPSSCITVCTLWSQTGCGFWLWSCGGP
ncbi:hypothetical protein M5689_023718 [Euphorbia peplus]|nr:hypothetical protein M5689_023718 [Euphorbia peplus]